MLVLLRYQILENFLFVVNNLILEFFSVPGPSSVLASISVSGFSDKYYFHGFLPEKKRN